MTADDYVLIHESYGIPTALVEHSKLVRVSLG